MQYTEENHVLNKIRLLCELNNYSFYRLSAESGVSLSTISSMFKHNCYPTIPTLTKLCKAFNISLSDFFMSEPDPTYISEEMRGFINNFNSMNPEQKRYLNSYINGLTGKL